MFESSPYLSATIVLYQITHTLLLLRTPICYVGEGFFDVLRAPIMMQNAYNLLAIAWKLYNYAVSSAFAVFISIVVFSYLTSYTPHDSKRTYIHCCLYSFHQAAYAEERLDALEELQEELDEALLIRKMIDQGMHDHALKRLIASTEVMHGANAGRLSQ